MGIERKRSVSPRQTMSLQHRWSNTNPLVYQQIHPVSVIRPEDSWQ